MGLVFDDNIFVCLEKLRQECQHTIPLMVFCILKIDNWKIRKEAIVIQGSKIKHKLKSSNLIP